MNIKLCCTLLACLPLAVAAQEYSSSYNTLKLPTSTHTAALGGVNVSAIEDSPEVGWQNPALYANVSDNSLSLNFMTYFANTSWMGAHFVKALGERHTLAVGAQYMNFGKMDETDEDGNTLGQFSAKDIVVGAGYSYLLSDRWSGGANAKFLFSNIASSSAISMSVDVGINYYNEETDLSVSASLQNLGVQLKTYESASRTHLPFTLSAGLSKGMDHLPVRFHLTLTDLTHWKSSYYVLPENKDKDKSDKVSFSKIALNHVVVGLDILPTDNIYLSLGYNFRRAYELKASGSSHLAGLSAGGGIHIKRFQLGLSYTHYHQAGNSIMANVGYSL